MKECTRCEEVKTLSEFYVRKASKDGLMPACKACIKAYDSSPERVKARSQYDKSPERLAVNRAYTSSPRGRATKAAYVLTPKGKLATQRAKDSYRQRNKKKGKARSVTSNGIRDGKIDKPLVCSECPSDYAIVGHHDDYDKPEEVRWLCSKCHSKWHRENGEALNPH